MVKLPGWEELGATPRVDGARPIGSYDVSPAARAGAALSQAGQNLGKGITELGTAGADVLLDKARYEYATAHADFLSRQIDINSSLEHDQDYATLQQRYEKGVSDARDQAAARISMPAMRARFLEATQPEVERGVAAIKDRAFRLEGDSNVAYVSQQGDKFIDQGTAAPSDTERQDRIIKAYGAQVDGLQARGFITAEQALAMKRDWAHRYALADGVARADSDPQGVINELRTKPGSPEQVDNRIMQVEGAGKDPRSSAVGGFIDSTWLGLMRQAHPELADRSDADVLALRADRGLRQEMTAAYRQQNTAALSRAGVEPNAGNLYLAHFLGPAGAIAVAKAPPGAPVDRVLAAAVGDDMARKMIDANPTILRGQTAGSVASWSAGKMGGVGPGGGHIYDLLRPDQRAMLLSHAESALHQQTTNTIADFHNSVVDDLTEVDRTGSVAKPKSQEDFIAAYGLDHGPQQYRQYQLDLQAGADKQRLSTMTPGQMAELIDSYAPKPGDGYAEQAKRQDGLRKAAGRLVKELGDDPAAYTAKYMPAVTQSWKALQAAMADPTATPEASTALARDYATKQTMEQQRLGIAPENRSLLPQAYLDQVKDKFSNAATADDQKARIALIGQVQNEAALWGEHWGDVVRELAPSLQPMVRAIAAGADPTAMTRLLALGKGDEPAKVLKEQSETKFSDLTKALNGAMKPFFETLVGPQKDRDGTPYYNLAEKLGALYVRDGMSASDAATAAFNALIGNRYDFRESYRIPKSANVAPDDVVAGAWTARQKLGELGAQPFADDMGLKDNAGDSLSAFARDGRWVTAPDNEGLNLIYDSARLGPIAVRGRDGAPLKLTWQQLASFGGTPDARQGALERGVAEAGAQP